MSVSRSCGPLAAAWLASSCWAFADAAPVRQTPVRHPEGLVHGYLALRTLEGETLAAGDLLQTTRGDEVTSRLVFQFNDGSTHDETAVFRQRGHFRLLRYRLRQKGASFEHPMEVSIDATSGAVTVRYTDEDGGEKVESERMELPPDLANGIVPVLLKNARVESPPTMHFLAATPKPRVVRLEATAAGEARFLVAGSSREAVHYVLKVEIGGVAGLLAPILGKQPPDTHVWIQGGEAPAFVKSEGPLFIGGPTWRIELTSPQWPEGGARETGGGRSGDGAP